MPTVSTTDFLPLSRRTQTEPSKSIVFSFVLISFYPCSAFQNASILQEILPKFVFFISPTRQVTLLQSNKIEIYFNSIGYPYIHAISFGLYLDHPQAEICIVHVRASNWIKTFAASYLNTQGLNNSCLKSPASTLVDLTFQSRALRSALSA